MKRLLIATILAMCSGCVSLSGFSDSNGSFACKAPNGITCTSVSGVYANAQKNNLPGQQSYHKAGVNNGTSLLAANNALPLAFPGMPIRSQPKVLRLWMAPWVDAENAFHDQTFIFVVVDQGKWLVDRSREETVLKSLTRVSRVRSPNSPVLDSGKDSAVGVSGSTLVPPVESNPESKDQPR